MVGQAVIDKPPYRVPSMEEIAAVPHNGRYAISTFSGCGGSSLGYKMAGFKVLWANEFIPAAQDTYRANHPDTILDTRDIRQIQPQEILEAIGMTVGQLDLMDGSPPCASFSTAGKREKSWGQVKQYSDTKQRVDDLFFEYARLVKGIQPKVFIAENVSGLIKGTAKGYFLDILQTLKDCGYSVKAKVLDAQWLGVPQMRQRLIFIGVRKDIGLEAAFPRPLPYRYTVREAIPWIVKAVHDTKGLYSQGEFIDSPCPAITIGVNGLNSSHYQVEAEAWLNPESVTARLWEQTEPGDTEGLSRAAGKDSFLTHYRAAIDGPSNAVTQGVMQLYHPTEKRRFSIAELKRICAFPDDFILTGTYAQQWERLGRAVPPVMMSHVAKTVEQEILSKCAAS